MVVVYAGVALLVVCVLAGAHWYLWRRLVRDVSERGTRYRRTGTALAVLMPLIAVGAQIVGRSEAPFLLKRILAWPGYLWLALLLYLLLALLVGEAVRPLLLRFLKRRDAARRAVEEPGEAGAVGAGEHEDGTVRDASTGPPASSGTVVESGDTGTGTAGTRTALATRDGDGSGNDGGPGGDTAARPEPAGPSRRVFVARTVAAAAGLAGAGTVGYGTYGVLRGPKLKRVTVPLAKLPRAAHGYRIAVVSDIHLGPVLGRSHTQRIVDTINRADVDMVAVVGDLVDGTVADLGPAAEPLAGLRSRDGSYFVTGNHEYFGDAREWIDHVRELGVEPLENARRELPHFDLAGVNDLAGEEEGEGPDFSRALGDRDTSRAVVLMAHQPVMIHDAVDHGVDLQLSGHTHGGQMWPFTYAAQAANPTLAGLERYGDTQLYVSRGAGAWGPPVRVGAESDITVVQLASARA
ncbi:metallophosphoesterase [Streptomyces sp. TRM43335]|uniref:Metallophosphoesterase n=1 Tax=Streptomyces taklimakanensis TaxID=2569853 RepID=A0A6G2BF44_9ACTN|nr:metallophosphoesterase [Streptomyces taklimakanensis]MTE20683.1 metallophosphoesterase [Streptomyces taklimakanensis]